MKRRNNFNKRNIIFRNYELNFHLISSQDVESMLHMLNEYFLQLHEWKIKDRIKGSTTLASKKFLLSSQFIYAAYIKNKVVGFVSYNIDDDFVSITEICVDKNYRKMGIGSKLIRNIFDMYPDKQYKACCVFERNETGKLFWDSLGFCTKYYTTLIANNWNED